MPLNADRIIITAQPESAVIALNEVQKLDAGARPLAQPTRETRLVSLPGGYLAWLDALKQKPRFIFTRHVFPVQYAENLTHFDIETVLPQRGSECENSSYSVQLRADDKNNERYDQMLVLVRAAEQTLTDRGFIKDDKNPAWAVSLLLHGDTVYAGCSWCCDNRSAWNGGEMRFKKDDGFISRAEFKLLEAFETFAILHTDVDQHRRALDLGAAPGGWTRALLEMGYAVTAVDPAALDERLLAHPRLTHARETAQRFNMADNTFALIVNDMRMDMMDSCRIMLDFYPRLQPDGQALMTLKLTPGQWYQKTVKALTLLEKKYRVADARQLFHNRDEVTVYLKPLI